MADSPDRQEPESSGSQKRARAIELPASLGHYTLFRKVGEGGAGIVYEGVDQRRSRRVAVKVLRWGKPQALYRFKREFRMLTGIAHRNLVSLYELVARGERWFYSMEYVDGVSFVRAHRTTDGSEADWEHLRESLRQIAVGLSVIHESGKLHRDVKPSNVLVTEEGRVVILDFGLITQMSGESWGHNDPRNHVLTPGSSDWSHRTTDHGIIGTVGYMSPEQAAGDKLTPASDWYAVGSMLFETLTSRVPFEGNRLDVLLRKRKEAAPDPMSLNAAIPSDLNALCRRLLHPEPRERPDRRQVEELLGMHRSRAAPAQSPPVSVDGIGFPFVGRQRHLDQLHDAFQSVLNGELVTAYLHGVSGSGKSALVDRFLGQLRDRFQCVVLSGRCFAEESVPFKSLDSLIDSLSRRLLRMDEHEVDSCMPRDIAALARLFPVLQRVSAVVDAPGPRGNVPNVQELRRRAATALRELLNRLGDRRPLVLCIDDLQWGDADSIWLLSELLRPPDPPRLLLLLSYRSEDVSTAESLVALQAADQYLRGGTRLEIPMNELSMDEASELAETLLSGRSQADPELVHRISQESGGSPYFVSELVRFVQSGQDLQSSAGDETVHQVRLDEVLWNRICSYEDDQRRLLEIIAVAGQPIELADAIDAAALRSDPQSMVAQLRRDHLVRTSGTSLRDDIVVWHDRIRESILQNISDETRQDRHRRLARVLEASGQTDPVLLAVHCRGAGELDKSGEYFDQAADRAADALAFDRAAALYRESLELRPLMGAAQGLVRRRLADALANAGRGGEAGQEYLRAAELLPDEEAIDLRRLAGLQFCICGHLDEGRNAFRTVLQAIGLRFPKTPVETVASLLLAQVRLTLRGLSFRSRDGELPAAERSRLDITESAAMGSSTNNPLVGYLFQTRNLLLALKSGDPVRIALSTAWQAGYSSMSGGWAEKRTQKLLRITTDVAQKTDDPHALGSAELAWGISEFLSGRYETAIEHNRRAEDLLRNNCTGVTWEQDTAQVFGVWAQFYIGCIGPLRERYHAIFQEARERGDRYLMTTLGTQVGTFLLLTEDRLETARERLDELEANWTTDGFTVQHHNVFFARTQLDLYSGNPVGALERVQQIGRRYRWSLLWNLQHIRIDLGQLTGRCALGALAAGASRPNVNRKLIRRSIRRLRRERMGYANALAVFLEAGLAECDGNASAAARQYAAAATELQQHDHDLFSRAAAWCHGRVAGNAHDGIADVIALMQKDRVAAPEKLLRCIAPWAT